MRTAKVALALCLFLAAHAAASGSTGVYAVIEKVVFEPSQATPERAQVWGAFSFILRETTLNGRRQEPPVETVTAPRRGYLYFSLPPGGTPQQIAVVHTEWADLKAMAGTGQAVSFGEWWFMGAATPDGPTRGSFGSAPSGQFINNMPVARLIPLNVHTAMPPTAEAVPYITNTGLVKLSSTGSHAAIVKKLRDALAQGASR